MITIAEGGGALGEKLPAMESVIAAIAFHAPSHGRAFPRVLVKHQSSVTSQFINFLEYEFFPVLTASG